MKPPSFTGDLNVDWRNLCAFWTQSKQVLGAEVGPLWETPGQHIACILFAHKYPDSKQFLVERLSDEDPIVAAYAFKCLIRVTDLKHDDIPPSVRSRADSIDTVFHSFVERKTLAEFMSEYFESFASREELLEVQRRTLDWQRNELAAYKRAKEQERDMTNKMRQGNQPGP